uniref:Akirin-2 n=1 Tax=Leptobrachium leishanense TaxID=445787 RepID=A0A8C5QWK0_9ANUR
ISCVVIDAILEFGVWEGAPGKLTAHRTQHAVSAAILTVEAPHYPTESLQRCQAARGASSPGTHGKGSGGTHPAELQKPPLTVCLLSPRTWLAGPRLKGLSTSTPCTARRLLPRGGGARPCPPGAPRHRNTSAWSHPPSERSHPGSRQAVETDVTDALYAVLTVSSVKVEQILHNIKQEYKRMQKRRHLENSLHPTESCCSTDGQHTPFLSSGPSIPGTSSASPMRKEQALFTLRQVGLICERLLKEREDKVREEYEEILTTKLAEQYDAFVKFTHDQIMRRYGEQPASYVS